MERSKAKATADQKQKQKGSSQKPSWLSPIPLGLMRQTFLEINTVFQKKTVLPAVQHGGGGSVMVWGFTWIMNSSLYQKILQEDVWPTVCDLKLKRSELGYGAGVIFMQY